MRRSRFWLWFFLVGSLLCNVLLCAVLVGVSMKKSTDDEKLTEKFVLGTKNATDKIAIIRVEGPIMETMLDFIHKQIEQVAKDDAVRAIVVRVDSPGGTITASEDIHRLLSELRDGTSKRYPSKPKPMVVSMGSLAASGGYYVAMPGQYILAETTTLTGSIGVYASLPNAAEFLNKNGIHFDLIKAGAIKASGSPFHTMTPQERQPWQAMVDHAYDRFLDVVSQGRPKIAKLAWRDEIVERNRATLTDEKGNALVTWYGAARSVEANRVRADGGTFTSDMALKHGLIDGIGRLDDAVAEAAKRAGVTAYQAVKFEKPTTLFDTLLGVRTPEPGIQMSPAVFAPQVWYLTPAAEPTARLGR